VVDLEILTMGPVSTFRLF